MKYLFGKNQIIVNLAGSQFQTKQTRSQVNYTNVNNIEKLIWSNEASVKMSGIKSLIAFFCKQNVNVMYLWCYVIHRNNPVINSKHCLSSNISFLDFSYYLLLSITFYKWIQMVNDQIVIPDSNFWTWTIRMMFFQSRFDFPIDV